MALDDHSIEKTWKQLSPDSRKYFLLYLVENLSTEEIQALAMMADDELNRRQQQDKISPEPIHEYKSNSVEQPKGEKTKRKSIDPLKTIDHDLMLEAIDNLWKIFGSDRK